jgi:hypothetical protein
MLTAAAEAACWCTAIGRTAGGAAGRPSGVGSRRRTGVVPAASVSTFRPQELKGPKTAPLPVGKSEQIASPVVLHTSETRDRRWRYSMCRPSWPSRRITLSYLILSSDRLDRYLSIYLSILSPVAGAPHCPPFEPPSRWCSSPVVLTRKISEVAVSSGTGASSCVLEGCPPASRCSLQPSGFGLGR